MEDVQIKAISTKFDGYQFRSRTEARWAVFFKEANTKYIYEEEGFELRSGRYLPDFYFPDHNIYVEIKGSKPTAEEMNKCQELCEMTRNDVILVCGIPGQCEVDYFHWIMGQAMYDGGFIFESLFCRIDNNVDLNKIINVAKQYQFGKIA